jgi:rfaE bifunctional protein kinase chain/domain
MVMTVDEAELEQFLGLMEVFPRVRVGVIGDLVADSYIYVIPCRLSREAPVIIHRHEREEFFPGGAANTVSNLLSLGAHVQVLGLVGCDEPGDRLLEHLQQLGADVSSVLRSKGWSTIAKSRILAGDYHTKKQQVMRIDREPTRKPTRDELAAVEERMHDMASRVDAWVVSDYGYQLLSGGILTFMREEAARQKVVVADSRYRIKECKGITLVTPNESELLSAYGLDQGYIEGSLDGFIADVGIRLLGDLGSQAVLCTRGNRGMMLFEPGRPPLMVPISGTADIVDVSGAGDTVVGAVTLALAGRSTFPQAARLANIAAGVKVMKHGTRPVLASEVRTAAWRLAMNGKGPSKN